MEATKVQAKTYYHNVPNSRYIAKDGTEHFFKGGQLTTDDPVIIADLDKVIADGCVVIRNAARAKVDVAALQVKNAVDAKALATAEALAALKLQGKQSDAPLLAATNQ